VLYVVKVHTSIHLLTYMAIGALSPFGLAVFSAGCCPVRRRICGD
jgi:hypothetical protein